MSLPRQTLGPIGVFDSGVGGLTVVRALRAALPDEPLVYLGDTARLPYGSKSAATVVRYTLKSARFLLGRGVRLLVVACNTASSVGLEPLGSEVAVPVVGVIEPGARAAVAAIPGGPRCVGVLGTLATIKSGAYPAALARLAPGIRVAQQACPLLVALAEEGWTGAGDAVAHEVLRRYLGELFERAPEIDVLVLGCTHYPLLREAIGEVARQLAGHPVALVDSATTLASQVRALRSEMDPAATSSAGPAPWSFCVTDPSRFAEVGTRFLGAPIPDVEVVDID